MNYPKFDFHPSIGMGVEHRSRFTPTPVLLPLEATFGTTTLTGGWGISTHEQLRALRGSRIRPPGQGPERSFRANDPPAPRSFYQCLLGACFMSVSVGCLSRQPVLRSCTQALVSSVCLMWRSCCPDVGRRSHTSSSSDLYLRPWRSRHPPSRSSVFFDRLSSIISTRFSNPGFTK